MATSFWYKEDRVQNLRRCTRRSHWTQRASTKLRKEKKKRSLWCMPPSCKNFMPHSKKEFLKYLKKWLVLGCKVFGYGKDLNGRNKAAYDPKWLKKWWLHFGLFAEPLPISLSKMCHSFSSKVDEDSYWFFSDFLQGS